MTSVLVDYSQRRLEDLLSLGVSIVLVKALFPMASKLDISQAARRVGKGTPVRRTWQSSHWDASHVDPGCAADTNCILKLYEIYHQLASYESSSPTQIERSASIYAIEHYLSYTDDTRFTADGAYSVIRLHQRQCSEKRYCGVCEEHYWTLRKGAACPNCNPPQVPHCAECGDLFVVVPGQGRPPRYCPACRNQRRSGSRRVRLV